MKLINPTDDELNFFFATKVAKWTKEFLPSKPDRIIYGWKTEEGFPVGNQPYFTDSVDSVLPWLEKWGSADFQSARCLLCEGSGWLVDLLGDEAFFHTDKSLPRAAVIALLRAHGLEIEFTQSLMQ